LKLIVIAPGYPGLKTFMSTHVMAEAREREVKVVNSGKTIEYLSRAFQGATRGFPVAQRVQWENPTTREKDGERLMKWQTEMAYMVNNIQRGPSYIVPKTVADCNKLIEEIREYSSNE
jgi:hypothetical protein